MDLRAKCESFSGLYRPTRGSQKYIYSNIRATFGKLLKGVESQKQSQKPPEILERMLMVYNEIRQTKSVLNLFGTDEEQVLYYLLKKCFLWQINDSSLVAKVLIYIYQRVGHFSELYRFLIWGSAFGAAEVDILEKTLFIGMIAYFLHHATESKLMFNGVRFIDLSIFTYFPSVMPCVLSIMKVRPNLLLLLLRYGAAIETDRTLGTTSIAQMLKNLLGKLWSTLRDATDDVVNSDETNATLLCAQYLLRAIPQLKGGCLIGMIVGTNGIPSKTRLADATQYARHLNDMKFVPFLANRYFGPSDLQHLCRCAIRKVLRTNWNLPRGIKILPIHAFLADYLDLLTN